MCAERKEIKRICELYGTRPCQTLLIGFAIFLEVGIGFEWAKQNVHTLHKMINKIIEELISVNSL